MAVQIDECGQETLITLSTDHTTYQMKVDESGMLLHTYYGPKIAPDDMSVLIRRTDRAFSPVSGDLFSGSAGSPDTLPQEFPGSDVGDFRQTALLLDIPDYTGLKLLFSKLSTKKGKYSLNALPFCHADGEEAQTLCVWLEDETAEIAVCLYYGVLEKADVITRTVQVVNEGEKPVILRKILSFSVDLPPEKMDFITFPGRHEGERRFQRSEILQGVQIAESRRGFSGHEENPFVILAAEDTTEENGFCMSASLLYSGSFLAEVERSQFDDIRFLMGIHPENFAWQLNPGESFTAPEAALAVTTGGFSDLSYINHRLCSSYICRDSVRERTPVLLNTWEAVYFDFDAETVLEIAKQAADLGVELLVLDDGWFGKRDDDTSGLGDWVVNEKKLKMSLSDLSDQVHALGMQFGLWIEPEMISPDSDLYRAHPDWALFVPGRDPATSRRQLVLDFSRRDVRDAIFSMIEQVLSSAKIEYVKWDANRHLTDVCSKGSEARLQGEVRHRYILGLYELMERLRRRFPDILFEGCSGGGGRFDAGMLYYTPQIWCSDNTDAINRLSIQLGTSYGYPVRAAASHVSAVPNHQTGRTVPLETRGIVAMAGAFGYELDPRLLAEEEKEIIRRQISDYKRLSGLIREGRFYRLTDISDPERYICEEWVSEDQEEALLAAVRPSYVANGPWQNVRLRGLKEEARYEITLLRSSNGEEAGRFYENRLIFSGSALSFAGFPLPDLSGDAQSVQILFQRI